MYRIFLLSVLFLLRKTSFLPFLTPAACFPFLLKARLYIFDLTGSGVGIRCRIKRQIKRESAAHPRCAPYRDLASVGFHDPFYHRKAQSGTRVFFSCPGSIRLIETFPDMRKLFL